MAAGAIGRNDMESVADRLAGLALQDGSAAHGWPRAAALRGGNHAARNLADAVHYVCMLHGRLPGVVDLTAARGGHDAIHGWIKAAVDGFAIERAYLTRLVVAVGPMPSTPGQADCEAAVVGQRHAVEMLAQSERAGCALGASLGLVLDWPALRPVLDLAAVRFGMDVVPLALPDAADTALAATTAAATANGIERAMWFGTQQLLVQHRGLWDLLESRAQARSAL